MTFQNVAIIGANGFIGSHLTKQLLTIPGINVASFGKSKHSIQNGNANYTQIDIENKEELRSCLSQMDLVYYLVSGSIPVSTWDAPKAEIEKN